MSIEAMKQALEAMNAMLTHMGMDEDDWNKVTFDQMRRAITFLRTAIEQAEKQEPVAWGFFFEDGEASNELFDTREAAEEWLTSEDCLWAGSIRPLYTTPPAAQRPWVGLTDEEIRSVVNATVERVTVEEAVLFRAVARAIEAKLRKKNEASYE